ncbi:MAG TPA: peptidyl-prolyl cis-trans isomerase [Nitrospiraceae bacterium]|nr:peptidyl-prolyl cis-trans isomerase [Nitrospiraceae bacterium]
MLHTGIPFHQHQPSTTRARRAGWSLAFPALTAACFVPLAAEAAHLADRIIAVVNSEVIMLSEIKAETAAEEKRLQEQYRGPDLQRRLQQFEYMALTRMIERKLQMQLAKSKGMDVTDEELTRAAQELQRQGEKVDLTNPNDKKSLKEQLTLLKVVDREVRSTVMVSETEMKRYYEQHRGRFSLPEEYRLSQILIRPRNGEDPAQTQAKAQAVYAALKQGGDFAELALKHSDGAEATRGGSLGFVRQGELHPPIERVVAALQPGEISEPVATTEGIHILRLDEKKPSQFRPFAEVKSEMQGFVFKQKSEDVYQLWMATLKNKAYIEVKF